MEIFGSGKQVRSYTYVDDLADALIFISEKSMNDDFNIGTGRATTVSELAHMIWRLCGGKGRLKIKKVRGYDD